ncbi:SIMPL domain-containing protein [Coprothermobacteraceae bacterium]|nr:SIMPL domain-containing protein [Coprothermobacteraceae bacterium]
MKKLYSLAALVLIMAIALAVWLVPTRAEDTASSVATVSVTGVAKRTVVPDTAQISFTVDALMKTAAEAMAEVSQKANAIVTALKPIVGEDNIQTANVSVYAEYEWNKEGTRNFLGYRAAVIINVKSPVAKAGQVVDKAFSAGATGMNGISYSYSKASTLSEELIKEAMLNARRKAEAALSVEGATPGKLIKVEISDSTPGGVVPVYKEAAGLGAGDAIQVQPGTQELTCTVYVQYTINQ